MAKQEKPERSEETQPVRAATRTVVPSPFEQELERFFGRRFPSFWSADSDWPGFGRSGESRTPNVDVVDREAEVVVRAELPGFDKDDIEVSLSEDAATIKASSTKEEQEHGDYRRREISRRFVARTVPLPATVTGDNARATYKDGILELVIPKAEASKRRTIKIES